MGFTWTKETRPRWDADKQAAFDTVALASVGMQAPASGAAIADEWWRVADDAGNLVGYGWLDSEWGDAQIAFLVVPLARGGGAGEFILNRLEAEAAARGLNYIYNVVPAGHPDPQWMTYWLTLHGFYPSPLGDLRRQVRGVGDHDPHS
jgi:GNAT superfamily N-acetyltransferase